MNLQEIETTERICERWAKTRNLHKEEIDFLIDMEINYPEIKVKHLLKAHIETRNVSLSLIEHFTLYRGKLKNNIVKIERLIRLYTYLYYPGEYIFTSGDKSKFDKNSVDQYPYIPSDDTCLFAHDTKCAEKFLKGKNFIDIGCGIGDKTILLYLLSGNPSTGLEYDYYTVGVAQNIARLSRIPRQFVSFIHEDAFDYKEYNIYDRIYTYLPLRNPKKLEEFYKHIIKYIKPGTMWFEAGWSTILEGVGKEFRLTPISKTGRHYFLKEG